MLKEIEKAVEALKAVPQEYRSLVVLEAEAGRWRGGKRKKPGPKPGTKRKPGAKKPGPKPGKKKEESDRAPVKIDKEKLEKLAKLKARLAG